ncbi:MAG: FAD-dependent oxidoreductase [Hyphomicrobiales bacterium]|nr:FAD-dependent oxidoreductase [Hyphomicrobiales bacterium]
MTSFSHPPFAYRTPPEISGAKPRPALVIIVGAGPIGLAAAIDLALHGVASIVLDDNDVVSVGSRAICWAKRSLEIFDRLGVADAMVARGVTWQVGRVYRGQTELYNFDLLPEPGHKMPAFINLQQYHVEMALVQRTKDFPDLIDLRWKNKVINLSQTEAGAKVAVETPDGTYELAADWLIACDGARSPLRDMMGLKLEGRAFEESFLIIDVEMSAAFPAERLFWFDPHFHSGQSALLHKQPEDIWRLDLQLGANADMIVERDPRKVIARVRAVVGERPFRIDWVSPYRFQCRRLEHFVHDRVIFAGDSAHVVSPFGARGGNGGIQDVDNLCWKLACVIKGAAPSTLLASYDEERVFAADENIRHSAQATSFMTPQGEGAQALRDAALDLAGAAAFGRRYVNSGRLSAPCSLAGQSLQTPAEGEGGVAPGLACPDAPLRRPDGAMTWLLAHLGGSFKLLAGTGAVVPDGTGLEVVRIGEDFSDAEGLFAARYGVGLVYLIRPDQHVAARFIAPTSDAILAALARAMGHGQAEPVPQAAAPRPDVTSDRLLQRADDVYAALINALADKTPQEATSLLARTTLALANLTGDADAAIAAIDLAAAIKPAQKSRA